MIERTPVLNICLWFVMGFLLLVAALPILIVIVASTHDLPTVNRVPMPLWPGGNFLENFTYVWNKSDFGSKLLNSFIVAGLVTGGKIFIASITAFSIVYFNYRLRMFFFWLIFVTLMLPLEVRIVPTYAVAADALEPFRALGDLFGLKIGIPEVNLLNTYTGLVLPLVATATGTFLFRQFFLTIPDELTEAAKLDGAGPVRFFFDMIVPLSRTNMAALGTIMFIYAWNQYLWPLLITTDPAHATAAMQLQKLIPSPAFGNPPVWNEAMAATLLVMAPPLVVVIFMQSYFVRGLTATEK